MLESIKDFFLLTCKNIFSMNFYLYLIALVIIQILFYFIKKNNKKKCSLTSSSKTSIKHCSTKILTTLTKNSCFSKKNKICNLKKLSKKTNGFSKINNKKVPGKLKPLVNSKTLLNIINDKGQRVFISKGIRKAGTRVGIHVHKYGGYTLVLKGAITDFVEGIPNKVYKAGSGYYMPPCTPMSACNLGDEDAILIDIFIGEPGEPFIEILEPEWKYKRVGILDKN